MLYTDLQNGLKTKLAADSYFTPTLPAVAIPVLAEDLPDSVNQPMSTRTTVQNALNAAPGAVVVVGKPAVKRVMGRKRTVACTVIVMVNPRLTLAAGGAAKLCLDIAQQVEGVLEDYHFADGWDLCQVLSLECAASDEGLEIWQVEIQSGTTLGITIS